VFLLFRALNIKSVVFFSQFVHLDLMLLRHLVSFFTLAVDDQCLPYKHNRNTEECCDDDYLLEVALAGPEKELARSTFSHVDKNSDHGGNDGGGFAGIRPLDAPFVDDDIVHVDEGAAHED
jgi:hypothetical protein